MISAFVYTGIVCLIYFFILKKKLDRNCFNSYSSFETAVFFALTRLCPLFMLEERSLINYGIFASDLLILAALAFLIGKKTNAKTGRTAAALYMFNPLPIAGIVSGKVWLTAASFIAAAVLCIAYIVLKKRQKLDLRHFLNEYVLLISGVYFVLLDANCRGTVDEGILSAEKFPIFMTVGIAAAVVSAVLEVRKYFAVKSGKFTEKTVTAEEIAELFSCEKFGVKDIVFMLALTVLYAVTVFWRLGNTEAPQTQLAFSGENEKNEVVLDLGEYTDISKISFFLGRKGHVNIALSAYNEVDGEWMPVDEKPELRTSFAWNSAAMNWRLRYIGIVFTDAEECDIREIVVVGRDGKPILPVNCERYPELFDEQELFPEYSSYYYGMMFDEIYHGRTAYEFLNDLPIYETTHPPLGKTIISLGIAVFGMTPFGWRFASAVCGTLLVPLIYLFCRKVSGRAEIAFIGAALFCTEFMHYTLSRIATIDIIAALFIIMMFYFMYCFTREENTAITKQYVWLILCGISTALAVAVKWTGVYAALGIAVIFFVNVYGRCAETGGLNKNYSYLSKLFSVCVVSFILVPAAVYSLSYIQFSEVNADKSFIEHAVSNSMSMFGYHSATRAGHPFFSEWYEWLIDKRPILDSWAYVSDNGLISTISTFGNPLILLVGLAAVLHNLYLWRVKGSKASGVLVIAYLSMLMPWLFIQRTVFIYQYFVCMILLCPLICSSLMNIKKKKPMRIGIILLCVSLALFIFFFPVISGAPVSREYVKNWLEWLPSWNFQ